VVLLCAIVSAVLGFEASKLRVNASFEKMIPQSHPYIRNYLDNRKDLAGISNSVRVVVREHARRHLRSGLPRRAGQGQRCAHPAAGHRARVGQVAVDAAGALDRGHGGRPAGRPGDAGRLRRLAARHRAAARQRGRAGITGSLVASDQRSSLIVVPLAEKTQDGRPLDYAAYSRALDDVRAKFETPDVHIRVVGFAKLAGDLIHGLGQVMAFFGAAAAIAALIILLYTRCWRSTLLLVASALLGVVWLLGLMHLLGFALDPYSILVPSSSSPSACRTGRRR
jgi:predicted RND superfamily exporter protein